MFSIYILLLIILYESLLYHRYKKTCNFLYYKIYIINNRKIAGYFLIQDFIKNINF